LTLASVAVLGTVMIVQSHNRARRTPGVMPHERCFDPCRSTMARIASCAWTERVAKRREPGSGKGNRLRPPTAYSAHTMKSTSGMPSRTRTGIGMYRACYRAWEASADVGSIGARRGRINPRSDCPKRRLRFGACRARSHPRLPSATAAAWMSIPARPAVG
jgi:hypothetical protein